MAIYRRLGLAAGTLMALRLWNPDLGLVLCPFRYLTALPCPLCGMTHALCALVRGEWMAALGFHALSPVVLAAALAVALGWRMPAIAVYILGAAFLGVWILRIAILTL